MAFPFEPDRLGRWITSIDEWLAWRREDMTASDISVLFDAHPFRKTREELAAEKRGAEGKADTRSMRSGRIFEVAGAEAAREEKPEWLVEKAGTYHRIPGLRLGATPDFWVSLKSDLNPTREVLETKIASRWQWEKWQQRPPLAYFLQTEATVMVTGVPRGWLAILVMDGKYPLHLYEVPRHEAAEARIRDAVAGWWEAWDTQKVPEPAPTADLPVIYDDGSVADFTADNLMPALLTEREALKADIEHCTGRLHDIDEEIKSKLGVARIGLLPGWSLRYPTINAKAYTVPARTYRRLTVTRRDPQDERDDSPPAA